MPVKRITVILIVAVSVGCGLAGYAGIRILLHTVQCTRERSAWGALETGLMIELNSYYREHGRYPDSLDPINMSICLSDGATEEMFRQVQYQSYGTSCEFTYVMEKAGELIEWKFVEGKWEKGYSPFFEETR
jgi:hypothetical protein